MNYTCAMTKMPYINLFLFYTRCFSNKTGIVIGTPIRSTHRIKTVSTAIYITHTPVGKNKNYLYFTTKVFHNAATAKLSNFFQLFNIFIEVQLIYKIILVSGVQCSDSILSLHFISSYYIILTVFSVLYNISLQLIYLIQQFVSNSLFFAFCNRS